MENSELLKRISARPDVFGGKPIIRNKLARCERIRRIEGIERLAQVLESGWHASFRSRARARRRKARQPQRRPGLMRINPRRGLPPH